MNSNRSLPASSVLHLLAEQLPGVLQHARVVGKWVWIEFDEKPADAVRVVLKQLGFIWNRKRGAWQHSCGHYCRPARSHDPRDTYGEVPATNFIEPINANLNLFEAVI